MDTQIKGGKHDSIQSRYFDFDAIDLVKIKIPGPKSKVGGGYDWVEILELSEVTKGKFTTLSIVLSPCSKPDSPNQIAHFYSSLSKNYFYIIYSPTEIRAEVHGRNEIPNYQNLSMRDKARNFIVANGGLFGFGKIHWEIWAKNILNNND